MPSRSQWLSAPPSAQTVTVRLIEEIGMMTLPPSLFLDPITEGHAVMNGGDIAFLIENKNLEKLALFDLEIRKDWWNLSSKVRDPLAFCVGAKVEKDIPEVLKDSFSALDFYGDGSFYVLDTPGHDHGHISALARTYSTSAEHDKDTFILLAVDACHFCGDIRPYLSHPFPSAHFPDSSVGLANIEDLETLLQRHPQFTQSEAKNEAARVTPWYGVAAGQPFTFINPTVGQTTANSIKETFDEADNVFVAMCHDLKDKIYWTWVNQFGKTNDYEEVQPQESAVTGFWMYGERYDKAEEMSRKRVVTDARQRHSTLLL
ncbi:hypothetical protein V8C35DRAFT_324467 [Trichoderma chlorosporum]